VANVLLCVNAIAMATPSCVRPAPSHLKEEEEDDADTSEEDAEQSYEECGAEAKIHQ
jgi:hypothetical protein